MIIGLIRGLRIQRILRRECFPPDCKVVFTGNVVITDVQFDPESVEGINWIIEDAAAKEFPA